MSKALLSNANVQAWLAILRHAEGTAKYGNPYGIAFTGAKFDNNRPHPALVRGSAGGYRSDASGAYQFLSTTWKGIWGGKNLPMTKENQDLAAIKLIQRRGVDPTKPLSRQALAKLANEWASLPNMAGVSAYGQPVKRFEELQKIYQQALQNAGNQMQQFQQRHPAPPAVPSTASRPQWQNDLQIPQIIPGRPKARPLSPGQLIQSAVQQLGITQ